jgi:hypothetical protein
MKYHQKIADNSGSLSTRSEGGRVPSVDGRGQAPEPKKFITTLFYSFYLITNESAFLICFF